MHQLDKAAKPLSPCFGEFFNQIGPSALPAPVHNLDTVGQGPTALAVGAGGVGLDIFTLIYPFSVLSPSFWETARYRLKYCLKGPLNPKQPTNPVPVPAVHIRPSETAGW